MKTLRLAAFLTLATALPLTAQQIAISKENKTIAISTSDDASALADIAVVTVGFNSYGKDQDGTYADATKTSNAIITALTSAGIPKDAIQSSSQSPARSAHITMRTKLAMLRGCVLGLNRAGMSRSQPARPRTRCTSQLPQARTTAAASIGSSNTMMYCKPKLQRKRWNTHVKSPQRWQKGSAPGWVVWSTPAIRPHRAASSRAWASEIWN
jgi:hypothetical protein